METKTHWKKKFNYDYMGSYSLKDGKDVILTIKETKKEKVTGASGKKEDCFVCYFVEEPKPMILNRTNCKTIQKLYKTPYIEEWTNKKIQVGIDTVSAFGESVEALRVRQIIPQTVKPNLTETHPQWNDVIEALRKGTRTIEKLKDKFEISIENQAILLKKSKEI